MLVYVINILMNESSYIDCKTAGTHKNIYKTFVFYVKRHSDILKNILQNITTTTMF